MENNLFKIFLLIIFVLYSHFAYSGPFSDFKAGADLSEEFTSSPTSKRNQPSSDSIAQASDALDPRNSEVWNDLQNQLLSDYPLYKQSAKYIQDIVFDEATKIIELKNRGVKVLKNKYNSVNF